MYFIEDTENYNNEVNNINVLIDKLTSKIINVDEIQLNQNIHIIFIPDSYKYMYTLVPKYGKVIQIKPDILILNYKNKIEHLFHEAVSYYGYNLGYEYIINLIE
jgi:hypothetical protein